MRWDCARLPASPILHSPTPWLNLSCSLPQLFTNPSLNPTWLQSESLSLSKSRSSLISKEKSRPKTYSMLERVLEEDFSEDRKGIHLNECQLFFRSHDFDKERPQNSSMPHGQKNDNQAELRLESEKAPLPLYQSSRESEGFSRVDS